MRWNRVITTSPDIVQKLTIRIGFKSATKDDWPNAFESIASLGRKHIAVDIFVDLADNQVEFKDEQGRFRPLKLLKVIEFFDRFGTDIVSLKIINLMVDPIGLRRILETLPLLKSLEIGICLVQKQNRVTQAPLQMRKLQHIKFKTANVPFGFHWEIFELIRAPCLRSIVLTACIGDFNLAAFRSFLSESPELEKIEMNKQCFLKSFGQLQTPYSVFKIRHLVINHGTTNFSVNEEKSELFHCFINQHKSSIEKLHIRTVDLVHNIMDFNEFTEITQFSTFLGASTIKNKNYYNMGFHKKGAEIKFTGYFKDLEMARRYLIFPHRLTSLQIVLDPHVPRLLNGVTENNTSINYSGVRTISPITPTVSSLKYFEVSHVHKSSDFNSFIGENKSIEIVKIFSIRKFDEVIDSILDHPSIKCLRFYVHRCELKNHSMPIYNKIKDNYRNLQEKLQNIEIRPIYPKDYGKLIEFNFPDEDLKLKLKQLKRCSERRFSRKLLFNIIPLS